MIAFSGMDKGIHSNHIRINLSHRSYFKIPKQNKTLHVATVIDSNDVVPKLYILLPMINNDNNNNNGQVNSFGTEKKSISSINGMVVASITAKPLGDFLENQVHNEFNSSIGFLDRNGNILYTQNQTLWPRIILEINFNHH